MNTKNDPYLMEGIGYDFVPRNIDRTIVDDWIKVFNSVLIFFSFFLVSHFFFLKVDDNDAFPMARRIIHDEGMFCGGSSGAILTAALNYAK